MTNTGRNFKFLPCELIYYGKTIKGVVMKLLGNKCRDVSVIVLKGKGFKFSSLSVINVLL